MKKLTCTGTRKSRKESNTKTKKAFGKPGLEIILCNMQGSSE